MSLIKLKNNSLDNLTEFTGTASLGDMVFISSATASGSASIEFSLGSYKEYQIFFVGLHPATDGVNFEFQCSTDGGSNYNTTITSAYFRAYNNQAGNDFALQYRTNRDLAQSTSFQDISENIGNGNDENASGYLQIFNPSSTTFVKHFISRVISHNQNDYCMDGYSAGYFNTTDDLTNIKFQMSSGNIDDGKILMFGLN